MSQFTQFFPRSIPATQLATTSTPGNKKNRQIFYGPSIQSWSVPSSITEVEVHVWGGGGGGNGTWCTGSGGGGGYARTRYKVSSTDTLCITVGGAAGTSSVTIPTQSPTSPVSATGGSNASGLSPSCCCSEIPSPTSISSGRGCLIGGNGGAGSVSLGPTQPRSYCFTACGGCGGSGYFCCFEWGPAYPSIPLQGAFGFRAVSNGGGAAGSPRGTGGYGEQTVACLEIIGAGGGIGGPAFNQSGGGSITGSTCFCFPSPPAVYFPKIHITGMGADVSYMTCNQVNLSAPGFGPICAHTNSKIKIADCKNDTWFAVEDIKGSGGMSGATQCTFMVTGQEGGTGGGGSGGWLSGPAPDFNNFTIPSEGYYTSGKGGFLGGGGGHGIMCYSDDTIKLIIPGQPGGAAGGSGGNTPGTPGVVIIYW